MILRTLNHPGIPRIYDLEDDDDHFYVIEEYICGESLTQFLLHQPFISLDFFKKLILQVCDIFDYLHHASPGPILYRDLKPEHLILSGQRLCLIDFGISVCADDPGNNVDHLGNLAFSAPESAFSSQLTLQSDICSIGRLMEYLTGYLDTPVSSQIHAIIQKAAAADPALRYETVEGLTSDLLAAFQQNGQTHLVQTITVVGSHHGCGTTHIAFALVSAMNFLGLPAFYLEENTSDSLRWAAAALNMAETMGCFYYRFFCGFPLYGPGLSVELPRDRICVRDLGAEFTASDLTGSDLILCVTSGGIWRTDDALTARKSIQKTGIPCYFISNFSDRRQTASLARALKGPLFRYPSDCDPFCILPWKKDFFLELLAEKGLLKHVWKKRKKPRSNDN